MDHVIDKIMPFYNITLDELIHEHKKGNYRKFSDNPYWNELKALNNAMNTLRKYLGWDRHSVIEDIREILG